jgi:hypothetical protein
MTIMALNIERKRLGRVKRGMKWGGRLKWLHFYFSCIILGQNWMEELSAHSFPAFFLINQIGGLGFE